eukprot:3355676-Pyramimonas_sp.AAC.1
MWSDMIECGRTWSNVVVTQQLSSLSDRQVRMSDVETAVAAAVGRSCGARVALVWCSRGAHVALTWRSRPMGTWRSLRHANWTSLQQTAQLEPLRIPLGPHQGPFVPL